MADDLKIKVSADGIAFKEGMEKIQNSIENFKHLVEAAFGAFAVEKVFEKSIANAEELINTAKRLDIAPAQLQLLKQAAKDSGTELSKLTGIFEKINLARQKALNGDAASLSAFSAAKIDQNALKTQSADQLFTKQLSQFANSHNAEEIGTVLKQIMGKSFGEALPLLKTDFGELQAKMKSLGLIMDTETLVKFKHLGEELSLLSNIITSVLGPSLLRFAEWILDTISKSKGVEAADFFLKRNNELAKAAGFTDSSGMKHSAEDRAIMANSFRDAVREALDKKQTFQQFKDDRWDTRFAFKHGFEDFKGDNFKDFSIYLNKLSDPLTTATQNAAKSSKDDMSAFQKAIADMLAKLKEEAYKIDHPDKPIGGFKANKIQTALYGNDTESNPFVKIGGLLGVDQRYRMERLAQKTNDLLQSIDNGIKQLNGTDTSDNSGGSEE